MASLGPKGDGPVTSRELQFVSVMTSLFAGPSVTRIATLRLVLGPETWAYARHNSKAIEKHWQETIAGNPVYFNGAVHMIDRIEFRDAHCEARLLATDFKSFLFWRDMGFPEEGGVLDGFGSALIKSSDGRILLGRQREGNINAGLAYLPGGFIDDRDIGPDGSVNIAESIARELREETGLDAGNHPGADLCPLSGFLVTCARSHVSFAIVYESTLDARALAGKVSAHIASEAEPELAEMVAISSADKTDALAMPPYARLLIASPLAWETQRE